MVMTWCMEGVLHISSTSKYSTHIYSMFSLLIYISCSCCSSALVVLGLAIGRNGVGVTQALNIIYHSPAAMYVSLNNTITWYHWVYWLWCSGTVLQIISTSLVLGNQSMTASCRVSVSTHIQHISDLLTEPTLHIDTGKRYKPSHRLRNNDENATDKVVIF